MSDEYSDALEEFDAASAVAESDELTFRFEVLIARLTSKVLGAAYVLVALVYALIGVSCLYFIPTRSEIGSATYSLIPSFLIILLFASISAAHYILTLRTTREQAQVALARQVRAQDRVEDGLMEGSLK